MNYKPISINRICIDFVKENKDSFTAPKPTITHAYERFLEGRYQLAIRIYLNEHKNDSLIRKFLDRLIFEFKIDKLLDYYIEKAMKKYHIFEDYDTFKEELKKLISKNNYKEAGKISENYMSCFTGYKYILKDIGESEHIPFYFPKKGNEEFFPLNFCEDEIKITESEDFIDNEEIYEFKFTEKEISLNNKIKEAFCQANFYSFIEYNRSNLIEKIWLTIFKRKLTVEIYVFEKNKIYSYIFKRNFENIRRICEFYKKQSGIDLYNLIKVGIIS